MQVDTTADWGQKKKRTAEVEMVRQHHWLNGHESEQTLADSEGQGSLVCCSYEVAKSWTRLNNWTIVTTTTEDMFNLAEIPLIQIFKMKA